MCEINSKIVLTSMDEEDIVISMNLACERKQKASNVYECQCYCNRVLFVVIILPPCFFLQDLIIIN